MKRDKVGKDNDKSICKSIVRDIGRGVIKGSMIQQQLRERVVRAVALILFCSL